MNRGAFAVDRSALAILWLGMAGFVGFHSFLLLSRSLGDPVVASFRIAWFAGLGVVAAMLLYFGVRDGSIVPGEWTSSTDSSSGVDQTADESPMADADSTTSDE